MLRSTLSQGRVDGTGGRGYYSGLEESLSHIVENLAAVPGVRDLLMLAEDEFSTSKSKDCIGSAQPGYGNNFLVASVWKPVISILTDRFSGMFTVGVAVAMHRAFMAVERFSFDIPRILLCEDKKVTDSVKSAYVRLCSDPEVVAFRSKWKLDLYFQVFACLKVHHVNKS